MNDSKYIRVEQKENCVGCTACSQICPKRCITMQADEEGFQYPSVDTRQCIECGQCKTVCPTLHGSNGNMPQKVYAEKNRNEKIRTTSSSGGVFYELAKKFIENGGMVYGCAFDKNMIARHIGASTVAELDGLRNSKYVQSDLGDILSEVKKHLTAGDKVLFSGTPCQVAGLRNYLGKDYEHLYVVDVLCHGVPSPKLFADYLDDLSKQYGNGNPISVNFRNKKRGWKRLHMEVCFDNGKCHFVYSGFDRYEGLFLSNLSLRNCCYTCKFARAERLGDITLGDFWGIGKKYPKWDDDKGISVVMVNTSKGLNIFKDSETLFESKEEEFDTVRSGQRTLYAPTQKNPNRDEFYKLYTQTGFRSAADKYIRVPSAPVRAYYTVMRWGLDIVRKLLGKGY